MSIKIIYKTGTSETEAFNDGANFALHFNLTKEWKKADKPFGDELEKFINQKLESWQSEGVGCWIELEKVKNKRKKVVENIPTLEPRKWITVYKLVDKTSGQIFTLDEEPKKKGEAIKKAKALSKEYKTSIIIVINKELVTGEYTTATINYVEAPKKLKNYVFFGIEDQILDTESL